MDKLEEIKKLKQLLDEGIIDENDFQGKKSKILGLAEKETDKVEETTKGTNVEGKTLDDYEKELLMQLEEKSETKSEDDYYQQEKIKARAKLDAQEEIRSKRKAEQKTILNKEVNKTKRILKWFLAGFLWLFGIGSVCTAIESGIMYIPLGILTIILGFMACPKITDITQKYQTYTTYKKVIVWIIVIIWTICGEMAGVKVSEEKNIANATNIAQMP